MTSSTPQSPATQPPGATPPGTPDGAVGLPLPAVLALALIAVPRVVMHDLDLVQEGDVANLLLVFVPLAIWIGVVLWARVRRPFLTLLTVGGAYGVLLALTHQLLWHLNVDESTLQLGGNLAELSPGVQEVIFRATSVFSSLATGLAVGAVTGIVALGLAALTRRR